MKIGTTIRYTTDFHQAVSDVVELEKAGLDRVWVSESYSIDAISRIGFIAARTERAEIGTAIINVYSRTASTIAQTAVGCDYISNGRFILGLGASGPQVIEGFHGMAYEKPRSRILDTIEVVRKAVAREDKITHDGRVITIPLPDGEGTGLGKPLKLINHPVRPEIPIWWASLMPRSVADTAQFADGWIPAQFLPESIDDVWGDALAEGNAKRSADLAPLEISKQAIVAIGDQYVGGEVDRVVDSARPNIALYWGGMGARDKNFYNTIAQRMGYEQEAEAVQNLYLDGHKDDAAAKVPADYLHRANLVGPESVVRERLAMWKASGVTTINASIPGDTPTETLSQLRELADQV